MVFNANFSSISGILWRLNTKNKTKNCNSMRESVYFCINAGDLDINKDMLRSNLPD